MFGLKRRAEERQRIAKEEAANAANMAQAQAEGREIGARITDEIDQFIATHARPIGERVYGVFSDLISRPTTGENGETQIDHVRVQCQIFMEELGRYRDRMQIECETALSEWFDLADTIGVRDLTTTYLKNELASVYLRLFERSVDQAGDLIQVLQKNGHVANLTADYEKSDQKAES